MEVVVIERATSFLCQFTWRQDMSPVSELQQRPDFVGTLWRMPVKTCQYVRQQQVFSTRLLHHITHYNRTDIDHVLNP